MQNIDRQRSAQQLREDILAIWKAGVDGVRPEHLIRNSVVFDEENDALRVDGVEYPISGLDRIVVVGAGKASGAMAETLETILEPIARNAEKKEILGWINVPEDCAKKLRWIRLHPARPMGVNEPTEAAVEGTEEIIRLLENLSPRDLCLNLLSGGGSALLVAPVPEIPLPIQLELVRFLSESGATIQQLNVVRKQISRIKGGGMKSLCRGKQLISLILSDVLGDPLEIIASGPTVDNTSTAEDALSILQRFERQNDLKRQKQESPQRFLALQRTIHYLKSKPEPDNKLQKPNVGDDPSGLVVDPQGGFVHNVVIGNNAVAVEAAGTEALRRGYTHAMHCVRHSEGDAEQVGRQLLEFGLGMLETGPDCLIHGGEPVVRLAPEENRGKGGRNQQLVLAALVELLEKYPDLLRNGQPIGLALLSGGTDGEDGPTDAAGAWIDPLFFTVYPDKIRRIEEKNPKWCLERNDAYHFFDPFEMLIKTGATGTNVCDLRIVLVSRIDDKKFPSR